MGTAQQEIPVDLTTGWKTGDGLWLAKSNHHLVIHIGKVTVSLVTGPKASGLYGSNDPGTETTYEVFVYGKSTEGHEPFGYMTLSEVKGLIRYLERYDQSALLDAVSDNASRDLEYMDYPDKD